MRFRSSGGYDSNDGAPHRVGNEQHSAVDQADGVESQLAGDIETEIQYRLQGSQVLVPSPRYRMCNGKLFTLLHVSL